MMSFTINKERCTKCGLCAKDCPMGAIRMDIWPRMAHEKHCIHCQHCLAVCPTGALSIMGKDPNLSIPLKDNLPNPKKFATLIKGRRSVRRYKKEDVDPEIIKELMETVWYAPTGVNSQQVLLTVMDKRASVFALREEIYQRLTKTDNWNAPNKMGQKYLSWATKMWVKNRQDGIFRGAPHFLLASAPRTAPCPLQDTHIALTYFELLAQSMGLGTLWNGMLTWCIESVFPDLRTRFHIPEDHQIGHAMLFGIPAVTYHRTVQRGPANVNLVE